MSALNSAEIRTPDEIDRAIRDLSGADWTRLGRVAARYARNGLFKPDDLLQEAFCRALDGSRKCPVHVDPVRFLAEVMRSVADGELQKSRVQPDSNADNDSRKCEAFPRLVPIANHGGDETAINPPDPALDPEQRTGSAKEAATMRACLLSLFRDDEIAQVIVEGMMEGIDGEDLRELTDLDKTAYQTKRRLIRRRINQKFPEGWTS